MSIDDAIRVMSLDDAKAQVSKMEYALVYQISEVIFDRIEQIAEICWEECLEGYFFDETMQIHIFTGEDGLQAVCFTEPENMIDNNKEDIIDKDYRLAGKYQKIGSRITKREYLDYDEDGQVYVAYTRLVDVK